MGYTKLAVKSLSWVSAFRLFYRSLAFVRTILLARLLNPVQFGQFGIAALVLALIELLTETGINVYLVQQDEDAIKTHVNTAWVISIFRGIIISIVVFLSSGLVVHFFNAPEARYLIMWMALVPLIRGFINPAVAQFQKQLTFNKEFYYRSTYTLVDALTTILAAVTLHDPLALVVGLLVSAVTEVIISHSVIRPRPTFTFVPEQFRHIIHNGKWVTSAGILAYCTNQSVDISIGKLLGTQSLGYYQMAYKVSGLFIDELTELVNRVTFPLYTKIMHDKKRLMIAFFKSAGLYVVMGLVLMAGVYLIAPILIPILLGPKWLPVIPTVRLLTLLGTAIIFSVPTNPLFLAAKKQTYLTASITLQLIALLLGFVVIFNHPTLVNIIIIASVAMFTTVPLRVYFAYRIFMDK